MHDPHDDAPRRMTPSDLLATVPASSHRHSPARRSGSSRPAASCAVCASCQDLGRVLADEATAAAAGWIVLERRPWFGGWRVDVPCSCAAGQALIRRWTALPADADGITLDTLMAMPHQDQAIAAVESFRARPVGWLTFGGAYGVGKTALIYAALNELAARGRHGRYTTAPELIDRLRNLVRAGGDVDRYLDRWCEAPLIAVDELDKYDPTEFADKTIFRLFNARYQRHATAGTLLAYNLDRADRLPPFLRSRIDDGRFQHIPLVGADVRPALGEADPWDTAESEEL